MASPELNKGTPRAMESVIALDGSMRSLLTAGFNPGAPPGGDREAILFTVMAIDPLYYRYMNCEHTSLAIVHFAFVSRCYRSMFSLIAGFWKLFFRRTEFHILILGVDHSGKTVTFKRSHVHTPHPTL
jgi:hypothetical protein